MNKRKREDKLLTYTNQPLSKKTVHTPSFTDEEFSDQPHKKPTCETVDFMEISTRYTGGLPFPKIFTTDQSSLPLKHVFDTTEPINNDLLNYGRYLANLYDSDTEIKSVKSTDNFSRDITYVIFQILKQCNTSFLYDIVKINTIELLVVVNDDVCDVFNIDTGNKLSNECFSTILKWIIKGEITELLTYMSSEEIIAKSVYEHTQSLLSEIPYRLTSGDLLNIMKQSNDVLHSTKHANTSDIFIGSLSELIQIAFNKYNVENLEHNTAFKTMVNIHGRFNWWNMNCQTIEMPQLRYISIKNFSISNFLREFLGNIMFNQLTDKRSLRYLESSLIFGKTTIKESPILLTYSFRHHKIRRFFVHSEEILQEQNVDFTQLAIEILENGCYDYDINIVRKLLKHLICGDGDDFEDDHVWIGPITYPLSREMLEYETEIQEKLSIHIRYINGNKMIPLVQHNGATYLSLSAHKQMDSANIHLEYKTLMSELKYNTDNYICDNIDDITKLRFLVNEVGILRDSTIVDYVSKYNNVNNFIRSFIMQWSRDDKHTYTHFLSAFTNYMHNLAKGNILNICKNLNQYKISNSLVYVFITVPSTFEVETLAHICKIQRKLAEYPQDEYFNSSDMDCSVEDTETLQRYDLALILQFICKTQQSNILLFVEEYKPHREKILAIKHKIPYIVSDILQRVGKDIHIEFLSYLKNNVGVVLNAQFILIYILVSENTPTLVIQTKTIASYYIYQDCWDSFWEDITIAYNGKQPIPRPQYEEQWLRGISSSDFINKVLNVLTLILKRNSEILDNKLFTSIIFSFVITELPTNYRNNAMLIPFQDLVNRGYEISVRSDRYEMHIQKMRKTTHGLFLQSLSVVENWLNLTHTGSVRIGLTERDDMHILLLDTLQINIDLSDGDNYFTHRSPLFNYLLDSLLKNSYNNIANNLFLLNCLKISKEDTRTVLNDVAVKVRNIILANLENKSLFTLYEENSLTTDIVALFEKTLRNIVLLNDTRQSNLSIYNKHDLLISLQSLPLVPDVLQVGNEDKVTIYVNDNKELSFILRQWPLDKKLQHILNTVWATVQNRKDLFETNIHSQPIYGHYEFIEYVVKSLNEILSVDREVLKNYLMGKYMDEANRTICNWLSHIETQFTTLINVQSLSIPFLLFVRSLEYFLIHALKIDTTSFYENVRNMSCYIALKSAMEKLTIENKNITCTIISDKQEYCIVSNNSEPYHVVVLSDLLHVDRQESFDIYKINLNIMERNIPFDIQTYNEIHNYNWYFNHKQELFRIIIENMQDDFREKEFSKLAPAFFIQTPYISLFASTFIPANTFANVFSTLFRKNTNRTDNYLTFYEEVKIKIRQMLSMNENDMYCFGEKDDKQLCAQFIEINHRDYFITSRLNKDEKMLKIEDCIYLGDHNKVKEPRHLILCEDKYEEDKKILRLIVERISRITTLYDGQSLKITFPPDVMELLNDIGDREKVLPLTTDMKCISDSIKLMISIMKLFPIFTNHIQTIIDTIIEKFNSIEIS